MTVALYTFVKATNELQKVYLLFGTLRSPLYSGRADGGLAHRAWQHFRPLLVHFLVPLFLTFYAKSLAVEDANAGLNFEDRSVGALPNWQVTSVLQIYFKTE